MRIRSFGVVLAVVTVASQAQAQIVRPGSLEPGTWASAGIGIAQVQRIEDYATASTWDMGTLFPWRVTVERTLRGGGAIGLAGVLARPTLAYDDGSSGTSRDAKANFFQILALFRTGGGQGFSQVIELQAGVTGFSNFREEGSDAQLEPVGTVLDPTFSVGYGFAYGFTRSTQVVLLQEVGALLHRRDNAPSGANTLRQTQVTRLSFRVGLGK